MTLTVADAERIAEVCEFAKKSLGFNMLLDISSIDNYGEDPRWTIVYELYRMEQKAHLRLKTECERGEVRVADASRRSGARPIGTSARFTT